MPNNLTSLNENGETWFLGFCTLVGIVVILVGYIQASSMQQTAGGIITGASLGALLSIITGKSLKQQINTLMTIGQSTREDMYNKLVSTLQVNLKKSPFHIEEDTLKRHRRVLHLYYRTRDRESEFWMHRTLNFSGQWANGKLVANSSFDKGKAQYHYSYEGYFIETRLLLLDKATSHQENVAIMIFPRFGELLNEAGGYYGIATHVDCKSGETIDPAILCAVPVEVATGEGQLSTTASQTLSKLWKSLVPADGINSLDEGDLSIHRV